MFKFENAHIVRGCSTIKCSKSIHGHSYQVEVLFESNFLDNAQMVYDFGLMKQNLKDLIEMFDHSITLWSKDDKEYVSQMKKHSARWVELPVSPSAEQFARVIFVLCDRLMSLTTTINGEKEVKVHSIVVHETKTGYAEAFNEDAYNPQMGEIKLEDIKISQAIQNDFKDKKLWEKLLKKQKFINPDTV
jgi:6-pyruvoyltetrahydropterin/6-carboxytetrahydropterin synthase